MCQLVSFRDSNLVVKLGIQLRCTRIAELRYNNDYILVVGIAGISNNLKSAEMCLSLYNKRSLHHDNYLDIARM